MNFLINCSNLKAGGGLQVAQSVCEELHKFKGHKFYVVLSSYINHSKIEFGDNTELFIYDIKHNLSTVFLGRDRFLDRLTEERGIDAVLTIFGPSIWRPRRPHLCGFARAQIILKDSPYYQHRSLKERLQYAIWKWNFNKSSKIFYTENEYISRILEKFYKGSKVYTVTNYYNQVFDNPEKWSRKIELPKFDGITCITIASPDPHKNIGIIEDVLRVFHRERPDFKIRFVLTFAPERWPMAEDIRENILYVGKVDVSECPSLYAQSDIMFMPTLMECFTATYPEAMRMGIPIVTTDLDFARGLCGDAACYYNATDAVSAAEAIFKVATDKGYAKILVENGKEQLKSYDNYEQRAAKLISILEKITYKY